MRANQQPPENRWSTAPAWSWAGHETEWPSRALGRYAIRRTDPRPLRKKAAFMDCSHPETDSPPSLPRLFLSFLRLGTTAFGGPAMVAYIRKMAVEQNRWLDEATFQDGVALCQTIPGATAMQTAAYVGLRVRGLPGAAVSFVSFGFPAFCFMAILSAFYVHTHNLPLVLAAFQGLQAMTVAIVANATFAFGKRSLKGAADIVIAALAAALFAMKVSPIAVILLAALLGLVLYRKQIESNPRATDEAALPVRSRWRVTPLLLVAAAGFALLFMTNRGLFDLGVLMFRIDLFAFGGGFASIPLMYHEIVDVRSWMKGETFMNGIALGQITPGPIVITATFVGYWLHGIAGAVVATASVFLPSFLMVVAVVPYFDRLRASDHFSRCMSGILASFVGLLLSVTIQFALDVPWDVPRIVLGGAALAALLLKVDVLWVVLAGIVLSLLIL
jgi:chromate transporter